jgi:alpha-D-ribose 1-methylphosphonate 5-triphosphate synthase subunit PhnG
MNMRIDLNALKSAALGAVLLAAAAGCATSPVPDEKIAVAKASVQRAEQSGAPELAPVEMAQARDKLARAQTAAADRNLQPATELAEQADLDAQVAEATAQEKKSQQAAQQLEASLQALRQESLRSTQPTQ